jgi:hypothetical protein
MIIIVAPLEENLVESVSEELFVNNVILQRDILKHQGMMF